MLSQIQQTQPKTLKHSTPLKNNNKSNNRSFKGLGAAASMAGAAGTQALNWLNTSPAIGACFVDFFSMVLPRTAVDFGRSRDAGLETGFRESSGTLNHAAAGFVGLGAGYLVSAAFNRANGVKAHLMFMDGKTIDTFKDFVNISADKTTGYDAEKYWKTFFRSIEGFNSTDKGAVWKKLSDKTVDEAAKIMVESGTNKYKVPKETLAEISDKIIRETGAGSTFRVVMDKNEGGSVNRVVTEVEGSIKDLTSNANAMLKAVKDKALNDKTAIVEDLEKFLKGIKNKKAATVAAGLAIPVAVGMSAQPLNRYLTKKRTGKDGFVGVEGRQPDHSTGFKILKLILGLGLGSAMISTILKRPADLYTNIKKAGPELLSKLQYKGMVPTLDQFKFIYGMTIMSRIMASRDKNEARETSVKDSLGFANWLILGGFISKLSAKAFNKKLVNYDEEKFGKGVWNFIKHSVEKTHEEILIPALKKLGLSTVNENGKALPFRKLVGLLKEAARKEGASAETKAVVKETLSRLKYKNFAQMLGYIYSGVVLGYGIPKLNIAITRYFDKKNAGNKAGKPATDSQTEKMRLAADYINKNANTKTFGAFYNAM